MKLRKAVTLGFTVATLFAGIGQAHAMNLLVAVGNPQIQLIVSENGTLQVVRTAKEEVIKVSNLEPAAGGHDINTAK